jgi:hypothetical protein
LITAISFPLTLQKVLIPGLPLVFEILCSNVASTGLVGKSAVLGELKVIGLLNHYRNVSPQKNSGENTLIKAF